MRLKSLKCCLKVWQEKKKVIYCVSCTWLNLFFFETIIEREIFINQSHSPFVFFHSVSLWCSTTRSNRKQRTNLEKVKNRGKRHPNSTHNPNHNPNLSTANVRRLIHRRTWKDRRSLRDGCTATVTSTSTSRKG